MDGNAKWYFIYNHEYIYVMREEGAAYLWLCRCKRLYLVWTQHNQMCSLFCWHPIWTHSFLLAYVSRSGLILHGGNKAIASTMPPGHCLGALKNAPVEMYNVLIGCPLPRCSFKNEAYSPVKVVATNWQPSKYTDLHNFLEWFFLTLTKSSTVKKVIQHPSKTVGTMILMVRLIPSTSQSNTI